MIIEEAASKTAASVVGIISAYLWLLDGGDFLYPSTGQRILERPSGAPEQALIPLSFQSFTSFPAVDLEDFSPSTGSEATVFVVADDRGKNSR